ncbi:ISAs1 family transposase [Nakamurella sp. PAMC28650]|nr:ISAs1 family transposase [Nakamurella sp. PAMC28650]QNK83699.1 ISAs1 family transposase [Nakamurella sp. PAMC28650]QNK83746.1 ISAs1 family transposase [Nakamurella sp. PAMC28650]QNK83910.1 ISAs1 family transposase [Nakamurella sp. PAMC28650]
MLRALRSVPDPRSARGRRHGLSTILAVAACAVIAGARSFVAIAEWAADTAPAVLAKLGVSSERPCESTIRRTLNRINADGLDVIVGTWAAVVATASKTFQVIAVDGKSVRGSAVAGGRCRHLLSALTHTAGLVLGQLDVDVKTNEIPMFAELLDNIELLGALVTADAMHCQKIHAKYLVEQRGAHYLLTVKGNQPTLRRRLAQLPWNDVDVTDTQKDRGHGRIEKRTLKVVTIAAGILFPHAAQAIQVSRKVRSIRSKKWHTETVYAVTDLHPTQASAAQLGTWLRGHWSIENRLHWVRDVTFGEDLSQARTGNGPQVMATLRNLAIGLLRLDGARNIAEAVRHHARDPHRPPKLVLTS